MCSDYAPPEGYQANQRYVADIYSFGVVVLEILSGMKHSRSEQHLDLITLVRLHIDTQFQTGSNLVNHKLWYSENI